MPPIQNVLLIDDSPIDSFLNEKVLAKINKNIKTKTINFPLEALAFLNSINELSLKNRIVFKPDIIFLDLHMPQMDGFQLLDELEKSETFIQNPIDIYVLSSSCRAIDIQTALNKRFCQGFFSKPLNPNKLNDLFS